MPGPQLNRNLTFFKIVNTGGSDGIIGIHFNNHFVQLFYKGLIYIVKWLLKQILETVKMSTPFPQVWKALVLY